MTELRYTLLSDGSSDRALIPLLSWVLRSQGVACAIQAEWADLRRLRRPPADLRERIERSLDLYPCDLLFIHRDAEADSHEARCQEIQAALPDVASRGDPPPAIAVVPVRMLEAWFLLKESALRAAAGNPLGREPLVLPRTAQIEQLPDPKRILFDLLRQASGLRGRRLKRMGVRRCLHRMAELTDDFTALHQLPAFAALEEEVARLVERRGWA